MQYIESNSTSPTWNLALEEYIFTRMDRAQSYFMLWQNQNAVIIGKNQNTVQEINTRYIREKGIEVVRRLSGGGAVYHDLGNLNFTFVTDADSAYEIEFSRFCIPVIETLRDMGIQAELNGRNDMTIGGKKFSGNAQYSRNGRVLHHGTLLFDSDLETMTNALRVNDDKIQSKGIASVSGRVTNIRSHLPAEMSLEIFKQKLLQNLFGDREVRPYVFSEEELCEIRKIEDERYNTWEWNYGYSPQYRISKRRRIDGCGVIEISMDVREGRIEAIQFLGDFFSTGNIHELIRRLIGCPVQKEAIEMALTDGLVSKSIKGLSRAQLATLIAEG